MSGGYEIGFESASRSATKRLFWEARQKLDAEEILERYGAQNISRQEGRNGDELVHSCLIDKVIPHHSNGDATPSAYLNEETLLYNCWSFGGGDVFWLIQTMEQAENREDIISVVSELIQGKEENEEKLLDSLKKLLSPETKLLKLPEYNKRILKPWKLIHPYMTEERHIDVSVLKAKKIGYDERDVRVVLPHFWEGKLVGWQKRRLDDPRWPQTPLGLEGKRAPKYQNTSSFPRSETLYNWDSVPKDSKAVLVVESVLSTLRSLSIASTAARDQSPTMSAATMQILQSPLSTFGAKVSSEQVALLRSFEEVIVWMDDDFPGHKATVKLIKELYRHTNLTVVPNRGAKDDLGGLPAETSIGLIESRVPGFMVLDEYEKLVRIGEAELRKQRDRARLQRQQSQ
ncbi:toprim domain-containing protein [Streptomyces sp. CoH17]|uniref:toprim domain-containing protein n=1 Tax=Streptomyces sp. CoH17 TaxID=2992806 RepID=UPI002271F2DC|nr:toprim domain-containing protein [Streptomyces sp. CoH17]